jgi:apolipoprotein D and lipocalin family protein
MKRFLAVALCGLFLNSPPANAQKAAPVPLAKVELPKMMGDWYLLATMPNFFEKGMVAGHDVYSLRPDGAIREDFDMRRGSFAAKPTRATTKITVQPNTGEADWRVHFFGLISLPFQVLYVDPDYRFALFGEQNRKLGWVYARSRTISDADYRMLMGRFQALGYDSSKFRKFIQTPNEIGQPGFWSDGVKSAAPVGTPIG